MELRFISGTAVAGATGVSRFDLPVKGCRILGVSCHLVTDATVADRVVVIEFLIQGAVFLSFTNGAEVQAASGDIQYSAGIGLEPGKNTVANLQQFPLPDMYLPPGAVAQIRIEAGEPTDTISNTFALVQVL